MTPKEQAERDWKGFTHKLRGAIALAGGLADTSWWEHRTLEELYKNLHPNGIKLSFYTELKKEMYK